MPPGYSKLNIAPLAAPDTSTALVQTQVPENVMWLNGGRGFCKRPGSLPFAVSQPLTGAIFSSFHASMNWPCALLNVRSPEAGSYNDGSQTYKDPSTLLTVQWDGVGALRRRQVFTAPQDRLFGRSVASRSDVNYYFYQGSSLTPIATSSPTTQLGELVAPISATATYNTFAQLQQLGLQLSPEVPLYNPYYPVASTQKPYSVYQQVTLQNSSQNASGTLRLGANTQRCDAYNLDGRVLIGGGQGTLLHYDGYRTYIAGAFDCDFYSRETTEYVGHPVLAITGGAGALTGVYQYMFTHVYRTATGEVIEGTATPAGSVTLAAQSSLVSWEAPALGSSADFQRMFTQQEYRLESFTTSTTGTVGAIVLNEAHSFVAGEYVSMFISGVRTDRQIQSVSGQTLTFSTSVTLAGTTSVSTGGGFRLYRTKAGGTTFFKLRDFAYNQMSDVFLIGYSDNAVDGTLVSQYNETVFSRKAAPLAVVASTVHQGRAVVVALSSRSPEDHGVSITQGAAESPAVYFSPASSPLYFPRELSFSVPQFFEQDTPQALVSVADTLYLFNRSSIHYVTGSLTDNPATYSVHTLTSQFGCEQSRALINIGNTIYFLSQDGLCKLEGSTIDAKWAEPVRKYFLTGKKVSMYYWGSKQLLLVSLLSPLTETAWNSTTNYQSATDSAPGSTVPFSVYLGGEGTTLVYDLKNDRWSNWSIDCYNGAAELNGDLIVAPSLRHSSDPTYFTRVSDNCNFTDSGKAFTARYYTPWVDNQNPVTDKTFNRALIYSTDTADSGGQGFQLTVKTERDWIAGISGDETTLTDFKVGLGYAETPYATEPYGDVELPYKVIPLSNQGVKSLRLILENSEPNGNFTINAIALETAESYQEGLDLDNT